MEAFIQRLLGDTRPNAVLAFIKGEATTFSSSQAHSDALGLGRHDTESREALGVDLRILLTGLVQG
jgi:hypothetical protein